MIVHHENINIEAEIARIQTSRTTSFGDTVDVVGAWNYCLSEQSKGRQFVTARKCMNRDESGKCLGHKKPDPFF